MATDLLSLVFLIVVIYLAFRIGAVLMKVLLGLLALALIAWLLTGLFGGSAAAGGALAIPLARAAANRGAAPAGGQVGARHDAPTATAGRRTRTEP